MSGLKPLRIAAAFRQRFDANFRLQDRIAEYEGLLIALLSRGYEFLTVRDVAQHLQQGKPLPPRRVTLRHDIDTDPEYADRWLMVESRHGIRASYYFRLRTLDISAMKRIERAGGEASYHFEELASVIRRAGDARKEVSAAAIASARKEFEENFLAISSRCGWQLRTVASHGDFVNRRIGMTNSIVVADADLRSRLGIVAEAYDADLTATFERRLSDGIGAGWRFGSTPQAAVDEDVASIQILTHPRHWRAKATSNLVEDLDRLLSGLLFKAAIPAGPLVDLLNRRAGLLRGN